MLDGWQAVVLQLAFGVPFVLADIAVIAVIVYALRNASRGRTEQQSEREDVAQSSVQQQIQQTQHGVGDSSLYDQTFTYKRD